MSKQTKRYADIAERVLWTAAQGALGGITVELFDLPAIYAPLIMAGLAAVKGHVATKLGKLGTASTLPASMDPAA